jgi:hypothetical protein
MQYFKLPQKRHRNFSIKHFFNSHNHPSISIRAVDRIQ